MLLVIFAHSYAVVHYRDSEHRNIGTFRPLTASDSLAPSPPLDALDERAWSLDI